MKKLLLTSIISTALITAPMAHANESEDNLNPETVEEIGFGTGALIGAIFGGPAGAFITGIAGTFIAKNINSEDKIESLQANQKDQQLQFEQELASMEKVLERANQSHQQELIALEQKQEQSSAYTLTQLQAENLLMSLQFHTGSANIPDYYQDQLAALAALLNQSPDINVDLSGYTDLLGDSDLNLKLSSKRADSVKKQLISFGVAEDRINTYAFGESSPVVANAQHKSSFYDRRVMIKIHQQPSQVAKNF
jgi:sortase system peptidoglycan-associated protein